MIMAMKKACSLSKKKGTLMPYYDFKRDFALSRKSEKEAAEVLKRVKNAKIISFNNNFEYDILVEIDGKPIKYEIKEDFMCERTGNVGVEFGCRGRPSGINVSKADYYLYKLHTKNYGIQFVEIPTATLKKIIQEQLYFRVVSGGDPNSDSKNYLFTYGTFVHHGVVLSYLQPVDKPQSA